MSKVTIELESIRYATVLMNTLKDAVEQAEHTSKYHRQRLDDYYNQDESERDPEKESQLLKYLHEVEDKLNTLKAVYDATNTS